MYVELRRNCAIFSAPLERQGCSGPSWIFRRGIPGAGILRFYWTTPKRARANPTRARHSGAILRWRACISICPRDRHRGGRYGHLGARSPRRNAVGGGLTFGTRKTRSAQGRDVQVKLSQPGRKQTRDELDFQKSGFIATFSSARARRRGEREREKGRRFRCSA
jgi:hypothetical protein